MEAFVEVETTPCAAGSSAQHAEEVIQRAEEAVRATQQSAHGVQSLKQERDNLRASCSSGGSGSSSSRSRTTLGSRGHAAQHAQDKKARSMAERKGGRTRQQGSDAALGRSLGRTGDQEREELIAIGRAQVLAEQDLVKAEAEAAKKLQEEREDQRMWDMLWQETVRPLQQIPSTWYRLVRVGGLSWRLRERSELNSMFLVVFTFIAYWVWVVLATLPAALWFWFADWIDRVLISWLFWMLVVFFQLSGLSMRIIAVISFILQLMSIIAYFAWWLTYVGVRLSREYGELIGPRVVQHYARTALSIAQLKSEQLLGDMRPVYMQARDLVRQGRIMTVRLTKKAVISTGMYTVDTAEAVRDLIIHDELLVELLSVYSNSQEDIHTRMERMFANSTRYAASFNFPRQIAASLSEDTVILATQILEWRTIQSEMTLAEYGTDFARERLTA